MHRSFRLSHKLAWLVLLLLAASFAGCSSDVWASSPIVSASSSGTPSSSSASADLASVQGSNTISADFVEKVLSAAHSPAAGLGQVVSDLSSQYQVDDAFTLAFFCHESSCGTVGVAVETHSWGNIICTPGWSSCVGRFRAYATWRDGLVDFLELLTREYFPAGLTTLETIVPKWAPSSDGNSPTAYIHAVQQFVSGWRKGQLV